MSTFQAIQFQSPLGDFGFLKPDAVMRLEKKDEGQAFQSPLGDFVFLKAVFEAISSLDPYPSKFQSPLGDFGFLKGVGLVITQQPCYNRTQVSIPSRGFWFFEVARERR